LLLPIKYLVKRTVEDELDTLAVIEPPRSYGRD